MSLATLPSNISLRIVPRPAVKLAGIRISTGMQTASEDVRKLRHEAHALLNGKGSVPYGVTWVTDAEKCSFDYCAAVTSAGDNVLPEEFEETLIPAGLYAECTLPSRDALYGLYTYLFNEWLPAQEEASSVAETPCYEVYAEDYDKHGQLKLYIPVVAA